MLGISVFIPPEHQNHCNICQDQVLPFTRKQKPFSNKQTKPRIEGGSRVNQLPRDVDQSFTCTCPFCFYITILNDHSASAMRQTTTVPRAPPLPHCLCMPNRGQKMHPFSKWSAGKAERAGIEGGTPKCRMMSSSSCVRTSGELA